VKAIVNRDQVWNIEPAMQRRNVRNRQIPGDRKMKVIGVKMDHIKVPSVLEYLIYHY
jgi:hypothetical protein